MRRGIGAAALAITGLAVALVASAQGATGAQSVQISVLTQFESTGGLLRWRPRNSGDVVALVRPEPHQRRA